MNYTERYWAGKDGDAYTERNLPNDEANEVFFRRALEKVYPWLMPKSVSAIEFGANIGQNLRILRKLYTGSLAGVEINERAAEQMAKVADQSFIGSMLEFEQANKWDLTFTKGCLIHIARAP